MPRIALVITDLDNTLYNWVDFYVPSYLAMVRELSEMTGISPEELKASFKRLHERYRTTEFSFSVHELDVLAERNCGLSASEVYEKYYPAIRAFRLQRTKTMHLYKGVKRTLERLRTSGRMLAAFTDSMLDHSSYRLKKLKIERLYDAIACPPDHPAPEGVQPEKLRFYSPRKYRSLIPVHVMLEDSLRKPNPEGLRLLLERVGVRPEQALYVGDSLTGDIAMAQKCASTMLSAEYGARVSPENYRELLKITFWNDTDLARHEELRKLNTVPTHVLGRFEDVLPLIAELESPCAASV